MSTKTKPAASANAAGSRIAHSGQAARTEYASGGPVRQDAPGIVTRRVTWAGRTYELRLDLDDPDWRPRALAGLHPLSDEAFAVRATPSTAAERAAFAAWAERELRWAPVLTALCVAQRNLGDAP